MPNSPFTKSRALTLTMAVSGWLAGTGEHYWLAGRVGCGNHICRHKLSSFECIIIRLLFNQPPRPYATHLDHITWFDTHRLHVIHAAGSGSRLTLLFCSQPLSAMASLAHTDVAGESTIADTSTSTSTNTSSDSSSSDCGDSCELPKCSTTEPSSMTHESQPHHLQEALPSVTSKRKRKLPTRQPTDSWHNMR